MTRLPQLTFENSRQQAFAIWWILAILFVSLSAAARAEDALALSIVPATSQLNKTPALSLNRIFYVVLTNRSENPITIYDDMYAWGYYSLEFEAKRSDGKHFTIEKQNASFGENFAEPYTILPNHCYVFRVTFDDNTWSGLEDIYSGASEKMNFEFWAIFEEPSSRCPPDLKHPYIWKGRIESPREQFHIE